MTTITKLSFVKAQVKTDDVDTKESVVNSFNIWIRIRSLIFHINFPFFWIFSKKICFTFFSAIGDLCSETQRVNYTLHEKSKNSKTTIKI